MDSRKIDELLARYWECETSLEEEKQLRDYFTSGKVEAHHQEAAEMFRYSSLQATAEPGESFDPKVVPLHKKQNKTIVVLLQNSMRIAAGIAVLVVAVWFVRNEIRQSDPVAVEDTYSDPKMAFEETKKALMMISKGFTKAEQETRKINLFNEAREEIQKKDSGDAQL